MSAVVKENERLAADSLQFAVFEKIRRVGADHANGQTIRYNGKEYGLTVNLICKIETIHVVIEHLDEAMQGHQQAMAVVDIYNHGYHGLDGASLLLPALLSGVEICEGPQAHIHSYRVLPHLEVPYVFAKPDNTADEDGQD